MTRRTSGSPDKPPPFLRPGIGGVIKASDVLGKRMLITGDVNTGKTTLAKAILDRMCASHLSTRIAIIDMAPEVPEQIALERAIKGVGGKLLSDDRDVLYLAAPLRPPRLSSKTEEEAFLIAAENRERVEELLKAFTVSGRDILFINDVSIYLQAGSADDLVRYMETAATVVANGYHGEKLGGGIVSRREASEMRKLIAAFPYHVALPATPSA